MQPVWKQFTENLDINEKGHLLIGRHDAVELAKEFGTPLYVLDEDLMRLNCRRFKQAMDEYDVQNPQQSVEDAAEKPADDVKDVDYEKVDEQ